MNSSQNVTKLSVDERLDIMSKSVTDLAGVVRDMGVYIYKHEKFYEDLQENIDIWIKESIRSYYEEHSHSIIDTAMREDIERDVRNRLIEELKEGKI